VAKQTKADCVPGCTGDVMLYESAICTRDARHLAAATRSDPGRLGSESDTATSPGGQVSVYGTRRSHKQTSHPVSTTPSDLKSLQHNILRLWRLVARFFPLDTSGGTYSYVTPERD
jgi:hypothetical protein